MSAGHATIDLAPLDARYEIVGELRGGGPHAYSTYFARRRDDGSEVIITVANATDADNNALSHLASDTQLLRDIHHPNLPQVLDGIWLGSDAFAVVSERVRGRTLAERLDRGERIANPRIAVILQDVATVLDWARSHGVVHRGVTPEAITFAANGNRVMVTFLPAPVPLAGMPDASADARTIGLLARDMLAGERLSDRSDDEAASLAQVRPDLATRVLDATERIVASRQDGEAPSIAAFLAVIASADVLKQAEVELAALKEEYEEQHQAELRRCEAEREAMEQRDAEQMAMFAGEREEFERTMADQRAAIEAERAQLDATMAERQKQLATVRADLEQERAKLEARLAELETRRVEVERLRDEAIAAGANVRSIEPSTASAPFAPVRGAANALASIVAERIAKSQRDTAIDSEEPEKIEAVAPAGGGRPRWFIPVGAAALLAVLVAIAMILDHRAPPRVSAPAAVLDSGGLPRAGFLTQSAGGVVGRPLTGAAGDSLSAADSVPAGDLTDSAQAAADSAAENALRRAAAIAAQRRAEATRVRQAVEAAAAARAAPESSTRPDTLGEFIRPASPPVRDTIVRRDTLFRRDTLPRRDTLGRPDTTRPRPDTLARAAERGH
jgi:hypothetical protein